MPALLFPAFILGICAIYAGVRLYRWRSRRGEEGEPGHSMKAVGRIAETVGLGIVLLGAFVLFVFLSAVI